MNKTMIRVVVALGLIGSGVYFFRTFHEKVRPIYLYKIVSPDDWSASQKQEDVQLLVMDDAFIHLATAEQVDKIIQKFWVGVDEVVVLKVLVSQLKGDIKYEQNPGGMNKYYHLYNGSIPRSAVVEVNLRKVEKK